ncbi:MAG: hypothetical protein R3E08_04695 [Thiotrichaceae bacterium]
MSNPNFIIKRITGGINGTQLDKIEALIRPMLEEVKAQRVNPQITADTNYWQGRLDEFYSHSLRQPSICNKPSNYINRLGRNSAGELH